MRVLIIGGGKIGRAVAFELTEAGHEVLVVERDAQVAAHLDEELACPVLHGDGCRPPVLEKAGVRQADAVVAVMGDDEDNLVACRLAKSTFKSREVVAVVRNPKNAWLYTPAMGVDKAVNLNRIISDLITGAVREG